MVVTGIGTRQPPTDDAELNETMRVFCHFATKMGWTLRSGGAAGMDAWFERLWNANKEIYIAWEGCFNRRHGVDGAIFIDDQRKNAAWSLAKQVHPRGNSLKGAAKEFHTRNTFQILGENLDKPSDIVVYYAKFDQDGVEPTGGTRTAVMLGRQHQLNEFNLILPDDRLRLIEFVGQQYEQYVGNVD